jgi:hypothetical protein
VEHGKKYYTLADQAPPEIKPVLLFYGMIQLMKACILTIDPEYPESSSVLAHGLSTRKRKKRSYEFFQDEVKVQKTGLFNHFCEKLFHMKHIEGEKFMMDHLFKLIPELGSLYFLEYINQALDSKLNIQKNKEHPNHYQIDMNPSVAPYHCFPLSYHQKEDTYYFPADREILQLPILNEIM